ncbi:MAG: hypothetical protein U0M06_06935, partial [Clostridia bacterium]|nr:hypothetical protein [Clostridia bacterium]
ITKEEFVRLLTFSNNPSSAFLISAVGSALWSCPRFGIALYIIELLTAFVIGAVMHIMFPVKNSSLTVNVPTKKHMGIRVFSAVMTDSALSMINVCALVLFFASLVGASVSVAENFGVSQTAKTLLYGFFEMTGACGEAAKLQSKEAGLILTALICGWSGLSVHFQVISISASEGVSFLPYFCAKACQGVLSALSMLLYIRFFDSALPSACIPALSVSGTSDKNSTAFTIAVNAVLGFSFLLYFTGRSRARISSVHDRVQTK